MKTKAVKTSTLPSISETPRVASLPTETGTASEDTSDRGEHSITTTTTTSTAAAVSQAKTVRFQKDTVDYSKKHEEQPNVEATADNELGSSPLWQGQDHGWELTWPIWHLLSRNERKAIAHEHGYHSIGEFEEYMSLQQTIGNSSVQPQLQQQPYPNQWLYSKHIEDNTTSESKNKDHANSSEKNSARLKKGDESDSEDDEDSQHLPALERGSTGSSSFNSSTTEDMTMEELLKVGGKILMLHDEVLHQVFSWLPVDAYGTLALVSPHWKHLTRTEAVYRRLCERLYLNQSKRRQLHVSRFGNSYRNMLEQRPRVRAAGGCYVMRYSHIKKIQRDMWTEIPVGAILETVYYRYLYFQEDGRVLYALSSTPPHVMFQRLLRVCLTNCEDPAAVWGTFQVQKTSCSITARQPWHTIKFEVEIQPKSMYGRYGSLTLTRHLSSPTGCFDSYSHDMVEYAVPEECFHFIRDPRL